MSILQRAFWNSSGFGSIRDIPDLVDVPYRFHVSARMHRYRRSWTELQQPCVIPLGSVGPMLDFEAELLRAKHIKPESLYYTTSDYHEMYKAGKITPLQVVKTLLDFTRRCEGSTAKYADAWVDFQDGERLAMEAAKASTERYAAKKPLGVLDGVPIGVKDDTDVDGYVNFMGMKYDPTAPCFKEKSQSAWPVKKLQEAGAVVIGKNVMHELGSGTQLF
jgi:hypothetical protein